MLQALTQKCVLFMLVIPALGKLIHEDCFESKFNPGYRVISRSVWAIL